MLVCAGMVLGSGFPASASDEEEYIGPHAREPAWSPDGTRILFSSDLRENEDIWMVDHRTGAITQLTTTLEEDEGDPRWSPDGQSIYFVGSQGESVHLYRMNVDGTGVTQISPRNVWGYAVSPDHRYVVLETGRPPDLVLISASGAEIKYAAATEYGDSEPRWSANGNEIMFSRGGNLWRRNPFTMQWLGQVTSLPQGEMILSYDWASTGKIAMIRSDVNGVFTANADGSGLTGLIDGDGGFHDVAWSSNGGQLAFAFSRDTDCDIWRVNADGTGLARVTDLNAFQAMVRKRPGKGPFAYIAKKPRERLPRLFRPSLPPDLPVASAGARPKRSPAPARPGRRSDTGDRTILVGLITVLAGLRLLLGRSIPQV
jgi:WD40 repeat protein